MAVTGLREIVASFAEERAAALGEAFVEEARSHVSRRTGALSDSIEAGDVRLEGSAAVVTVKVGEEYGIYQDQGTGIYGPTGQRIRPHAADGVLAFDWPAGGGLTFARSVAGSEPTRFWQRTVEAWSSIVRAAA